MGTCKKISMLCIGLVCSLMSAMDPRASSAQGAGVLAICSSTEALYGEEPATSWVLMVQRKAQGKKKGAGKIATLGGPDFRRNLKVSAVASFVAKTNGVFCCGNHDEVMGNASGCVLCEKKKNKCAQDTVARSLGNEPIIIEDDDYALFVAHLEISNALLAVLNAHKHKNVAKYVLVSLSHLQRRIAEGGERISCFNGAEVKTYTLWDQTAELLRNSETFAALGTE